MSSRCGLIVITLIIVALVVALIQIAPEKQGKSGANDQNNDLIAPQLSSTEALAAWHSNPLNEQQNDDAENREQLTAAWKAFCGKFSPLPRFDELTATFRVRTLAAGYGEDTGFSIAMSSEWDAETIAEKLRPFRKRLNTLAAHRVDINRMDNGVLVETHELKPAGKIYILRHGSWVIATNVETNLPVLAKAAVEQTPDKKEDITPATYSALSEILKSYENENLSRQDE